MNTPSTPPPPANNMLRKSNPEMSPNPSCAPMNPPTIAPMMPRAMVTMIPPGTLPGMRNLAMAPATRPNTAHNRMPMVDLPFEVAGSGATWARATGLYAEQYGSELAGCRPAIAVFLGVLNTLDNVPGGCLDKKAPRCEQAGLRQPALR